MATLTPEELQRKAEIARRLDEMTEAAKANMAKERALADERQAAALARKP
jgi:hypothetical protein